MEGFVRIRLREANLFKLNYGIIKPSFLFALAILLYGITTCWDLSVKWMIITLSMFMMPLACLFLKNQIIKTYAIWFGVFLVLQSLLSPYFIDEDYKTLKPNLDIVTDVRGGLPGISGPQHLTTDSKGFRVTKNIDYSDDENYRIYAIGASTTEQIFLDDKNFFG